MEFIWVRWLGVVPGHSFGRKQARLPKIGFVPDSDEFAFGFLDPAHIIHGCHLIPSFVDGKSTELLSVDSDSEGVTEARPIGGHDDWAYYYVAM